MGPTGKGRDVAVSHPDAQITASELPCLIATAASAGLAPVVEAILSTQGIKKRE